MARMQETTKQLEQQRRIKVSVILFSLTRLGCETTRCMHQYYFGLTTISFPK